MQYEVIYCIVWSLGLLLYLQKDCFSVVHFSLTHVTKRKHWTLIQSIDQLLWRNNINLFGVLVSAWLEVATPISPQQQSRATSLLDLTELPFRYYVTYQNSRSSLFTLMFLPASLWTVSLTVAPFAQLPSVSQCVCDIFSTGGTESRFPAVGHTQRCIQGSHRTTIHTHAHTHT